MMKIKFITNLDVFLNDYMDIIRAFYPHITLDENEGIEVKLITENIKEDYYVSKIYLDKNCLAYYEKEFNLEKYKTEIEKKSLIKRWSKVCLYEALTKLLNVKLPYGSLTGIRPTKLYHDLKSKGIDANDYFENKLKVSKEKTSLVSIICKNQENIYTRKKEEVDVFVNIPICVTRCSYCSFISAELKRVKNLICPYTEMLLKELELTRKIVLEQNLKVRSVYIGGGTPTSIDDENFEKIISAANFNVDEYTVEAGRPDTITKNKLDIMQKHHVTRISINPQSFNQKTLDLIGRSHLVEDVINVYNLAREYPFNINMDLIAMLPNESFEDFKYSVDKAISLSPENITVHTLALKRGSKLHEDNYDNYSDHLPSLMVDYAMKAIMDAGYEPYYMYKQKHVSGNLENVGYCKKGKACIYNVDIMEETTTIIANGAGAISKLVLFDENRIERLPEPKAIEIYLQRENEILENKYKFFKNF